ncbi:BTB/POZ and TAZ domain-containing protein 4 [Hibiscus syriacus]|uniref:BTB/POZ and TAZ domain-containing protein 4 n=1 Tax=Hibiscus syriacus TaxID=106335 RepID=A0A6A3B2U3_HIBSY|nr:BTB/POZ and TAZ domain-containing protein 4 [Hibiscus syriacus]
MAVVTKQSHEGSNDVPPTPPPLPGPATNCQRKGLFTMSSGSVAKGNSYLSTSTRDMCDNLFDGGFRADVIISTDNGGIIYAHTSVFGMASPVLRGMLKQAKGSGCKMSISIPGVQHDAVRVFIRFLYSSCYEQEEMKELVMRKEKIRGSNERKIYLQLYEAMEALIHICRDGCRSIGPYDTDFKEDQKPCTYAACKGIELLVRHFAGCKLRVPGGCIHCKRMWQLLELHARLCADPSLCRVPLCMNFKEKIKKQGKKDVIKWKMLVKKIQDGAPKLHEQSATELLSSSSRLPGSVEDGEEVNQAAGSPSIQSRSPVRALLGISFNAKGMWRVTWDGLESASETCYCRGELPDSSSFRKRLEQRLELEGLSISVDYADVLNISLDVFV